MASDCVIVGAGHAGAQLCASLRQAGWGGRITLVGDEPLAPYHRPPLSKTGLDPRGPQEPQLIRPEAFYHDQQIELRLGETVRAIDRDARTVQVGVEELPYHTLVLATGSVHRRPDISGLEHPRVLSLRTAADATTLRSRLGRAERVTIIGAGFIGLEVASSLRKMGRSVTVLERASRALSRVTSAPVSSFFEELHRAHGVRLQTDVVVAAVEATGQELVLRDDDGAVLCHADLVVLGAGAGPNDELARRCGLAVENGIVVDERQRTSDPSIYAIGDCCSQFHSLYRTRLRLESVQNAVDQARTVAAAMCGAPLPAPTVPWFWSDQYDVKLQMVGISAGYDQCAVRGQVKPGAGFSAWYLRQGRLVAVDAINDPRAYVVASKLIAGGARPDFDTLSDTQFDLKQLLSRREPS